MALGVFWASVALLLFLAILSLDIMGLFNWKNKFPVEGRTVLLTGGSQGMGREVAKLLAQRGANIVIVARDSKKLQAALEYIQPFAKFTHQRFHVISADVTIESENDRILAEATAWNNGKMPEIVWQIAGGSKPALFLETNIETMKKQMDLNYWSSVYLAQKTLKAWLYPDTPYARQEKGKLASEAPRQFIMTSSVVAFVNIAGYGPYGPAKTAMRALADTLRSEIAMYNAARRSSKITNQTPAPFDIEVQIVFPGTIRSPGLELENKSKHPVTHLLEASDPVQSELEAAISAVKGLENGNFITPTNWLGELMRLSSLGGSPRNNWPKDILGQWITSLVWIFVLPDLQSKVWGYGKKEGMPELRENAN